MAKGETDRKQTDEELFIGAPDEGFWTAKRLTPRRAVRFHNWLANVLGNVAQVIGEPGEEGIDWPNLLGRLIDALSDEKLIEILSIASGHTAEEIEANYDYAASMRCLVDFVEVNEIGTMVADFFGRASGRASG